MRLQAVVFVVALAALGQPGAAASASSSAESALEQLGKAANAEGSNIQPAPVVKPRAPSPAAGGHGAALKAQLREMCRGARLLGYSAARGAVFRLYQNEQGYVWDVYGQRWSRRPGIDAVLGSPEDINIEHVFAQNWFDHDKAKKSDLHNLLPTDNRLNADRGHQPFGEVAGCSPDRTCTNGRITEVPDAVKGDVARAVFYFAACYGYSVADDMEAALKSWDEQDPPDAGERSRNDQKALLQGSRNPFIDDSALDDKVGDL